MNQKELERLKELSDSGHKIYYKHYFRCGRILLKDEEYVFYYTGFMREIKNTHRYDFRVYREVDVWWEEKENK